MKALKKLSAIVFTCILFTSFLTGCSKSNKEKIIIYSSSTDTGVEFMQQRLKEQFPDYEIVVDYISTGDHAAKLISEGIGTECDITFDLEYGYLEKLASAGVLEDLTNIADFTEFREDTVRSNYYIPTLRNGGAIIINPDVIKDKNLEIPNSYSDLLDPQYKGLVSMPNPKSSGTGYMFLKSLVNTWGEEKAFEYFDQLTPNILQYTSSGSGPVNALLQKEVAIGLGMTSQAVEKINDNGANFQIKFFEEGSPYSLCGAAIIKGKSEREAVKKVFEFIDKTFIAEYCERFYPEQIFNDKAFEIKNYPANIKYSDMSNDNYAEKERLLAKWKY